MRRGHLHENRFQPRESSRPSNQVRRLDHVNVMGVLRNFIGRDGSLEAFYLINDATGELIGERV